MFSIAEKRAISSKIQKIIQDTEHWELPAGEINFIIHIEGFQPWSYADIKNNGAVECPTVNPFNEMQKNR